MWGLKEWDTTERLTHLQERKEKSLSRVRLFASPWAVAYRAPPSMEFSRQEYGSGLPFPSPGDLPDPGIESMSPALAGGFFTAEPPGKPINIITAEEVHG